MSLVLGRMRTVLEPGSDIVAAETESSHPVSHQITDVQSR